MFLIRKLLSLLVVSFITTSLFFVTTSMPDANAMVPLSEYSCGVTLNSGGTEYLPSDISGCDDGAPAVTITGHTALDLRGHKISCNDTDADTILPVGVMMIGSHASIMNGTIDGCDVGVSFGDKYSSSTEGHHTVRDMVIEDSVTDGIQAFSDNNMITHSRILTPGDDGLEVTKDSTGNGISFSVISSAGGDGVYFIGNNNRTSYLKVTGSGSDGIEIDGDHDSVNHSDFENSTASGLNLGGKYTSVRYSHFGSNVHGIYLTSVSENATIANNTVTNNSAEGIEINGSSEDNKVMGNVVTGNVPTDIKDGSGSCDQNDYEDNFFGTSDPSCIE